MEHDTDKLLEEIRGLNILLKITDGSNETLRREHHKLYAQNEQLQQQLAAMTTSYILASEQIEQLKKRIPKRLHRVKGVKKGWRVQARYLFFLWLNVGPRYTDVTMATSIAYYKNN